MTKLLPHLKILSGTDQSDMRKNEKLLRALPPKKLDFPQKYLNYTFLRKIQAKNVPKLEKIPESGNTEKIYILFQKSRQEYEVPWNVITQRLIFRKISRSYLHMYKIYIKIYRDAMFHFKLMTKRYIFDH